MLKKPRILYITARSDRSGGPVHVRDLLRSISLPKENLFIACPSNGELAMDYMSSVNSLFNIPFRSFSLIAFLRLTLFCRKNQISIVHSHGRGASYYSKLLNLLGYKVIHSFHGVHSTPDLVSHVKSLIDRVTKLLVNRFISVSASEKKLAIQFGFGGKDQISLVENGVDLEHIDLEQKASGHNELRERFNLSPKTKIFGTIARNDPVKSIDLLTSRIEKMEDEDFVLIIAGGGYDKTSTNKVIYLGETANPLKFLKDVDVYISHSSREGMPLSVLEAMAMRKLCMLSRVTGHVDLIEDGKTGLLFDHDSFEDFSSKVSDALANDYSGYIEAARRKIETSHTLDTMSQKTLEIYL